MRLFVVLVNGFVCLLFRDNLYAGCVCLCDDFMTVAIIVIAFLPRCSPAKRPFECVYTPNHLIIIRLLFILVSISCNMSHIFADQIFCFCQSCTQSNKSIPVLCLPFHWMWPSGKLVGQWIANKQREKMCALVYSVWWCCVRHCGDGSNDRGEKSFVFKWTLIKLKNGCMRWTTLNSTYVGIGNLDAQTPSHSHTTARISTVNRQQNRHWMCRFLLKFNSFQWNGCRHKQIDFCRSAERIKNLFYAGPSPPQSFFSFLLTSFFHLVFTLTQYN